MRFAAALLFALLLPVAAPAATTPTPPSLDQLFGQLRRAGSTDEAKPIEDKIGGIFSHIGGIADGQPNICGVKRRCIIDAVAHVANNMAHFLERQDDPFLLVRIDLGKQVSVIGRM